MASFTDSVDNVYSAKPKSILCSTADFSELFPTSVKAGLSINRKANVGMEASIAVPSEGGSHSDPSSSSTVSDSVVPLGGSSPKARRKRDSGLPDSDCGVSMPPPKRRKSRTWFAKRVRFHPEVFDNSLWAELNDAKYASERPLTPFRERPSLSTSEEDDFATPVAGISPCTTIAACNVPRGSLSFLPRTPGSNAFSRDVPAAATGYITDTEISSDTLDLDEAWSVCAECDADFAPRECDDVSVPRSSPPPSARGMISASPYHIGDSRSRPPDDSGREKGKTQDELPSIFTRPPSKPSHLTGVAHGRPGVPSPAHGNTDPSTSTHPLFTTGEIVRYSRILLTALAKLPTDEARASREALEQVARWQGQRGYEAGYREGMRSQIESTCSRDRTLLNTEI